MRTLSTGDTFRLLRGTRTVSVGAAVVELVVVFDESIFIPDMLDESLVMFDVGGVVVVVLLDEPAVLSLCVLCVGVGAVAPVPYCFEDESVVVVVVVEGEAVVLLDVELDDESVVVDADGVVVVDEDGVVVVEDDELPDIDDESVVVEDDGVVVVDEDGVEVTSPVDVECEPSFETRMWLLVWPSTTAGERAIAAIAMSLIFMSSP